jgi:hypothetical protein
VIVEVSSLHLFQPVAGLLNRIVDSPAQPGCYIVQLRYHALPNRFALHRKLAALVDRATDMLASSADDMARLILDKPDHASSPLVDPDN